MPDKSEQIVPEAEKKVKGKKVAKKKPKSGEGSGVVVPVEASTNGTAHSSSAKSFSISSMVVQPERLENIASPLAPGRIEAKKRDRFTFFRSNPDPAYQAIFMMMEFPDIGACIISTENDMHKKIEGGVRPILLRTCQTMGGLTYLWPLKISPPGARENEWNLGALRIATISESSWVRFGSNGGSYSHQILLVEHPAPVWPTRPFMEMVEEAFEDRIITNLADIRLQRYRGEVI